MRWTDQVFAYCERGGDPGLWAEPANAVSNAAFLVAAGAALAIWLRQPDGRRDPAVLALIGLVAAIGVGSFLFHTFATRWARLADTAPIAIFMLGYLGFALRRFLDYGRATVIAASLAFVAAAALAGQARCGGGPCANGSLGYLPALLSLAIVGVLALRACPSAGRRLLSAAALLSASIVFRSVDLATCPALLVPPAWKIGTHTVWHLLNAAVLYLLLMAAIMADECRGNGKK